MATEPIMAYRLGDNGPLVCPDCVAEGGLQDFYTPEQIAGATALTHATYPYDERRWSCDCCAESLEPEAVYGQ